VKIINRGASGFCVKDRRHCLLCAGRFSSHHEERLSASSHRQAKSMKVFAFTDFFHLSHFCLIVFFVIFVSSVVDTSPQETQNSKQETMKAAISMIKNREDYVQLVHTLTRLD
jgi:hypothetical protein